LDDYCKLLTGHHDYSAFVHKEARKDRDNVMTLKRLECERVMTMNKDGAPICEVRFLVEAKGFGRSQVRNFVGFIVDLCRGSIKDKESIQDWLWTDSDQVAKTINAARKSCRVRYYIIDK
jgi:tRNA U38,U39,U40 pseudouridine synthase TruA